MGKKEFDYGSTEVLEILPFGVMVLDEQNRVIYANAAAESVIHHFESIMDCFSDSMTVTSPESEGRGFAGKLGLGKRSLTRWVTLDGRNLAITCTYMSGNGKPDMSEAHGVMSIQDVSESQSAEVQNELLRESIQDLESVFDSSYDEVFVTDGEGNTLRVNAACERLYGIPASEFVGKNVRELEQEGIFCPSITPYVLKQRRRVTIAQKTKTGRTVVATANPVFDDEGNIVRIVTNSRDITEFQTMEDPAGGTQQLVNRYLDEIENCCQEQSEVNHFVAESQLMKDVVSVAKRVARFDSTVLLQGESGTGKDSIAKLIHTFSDRAHQPFLKINCGAIPETLLESQFFGYVSGAFTGAHRGGRAGVVEKADKGTLFLNEIDGLPLSLQVKLLHIIEERRFFRVGGTQEIKVDVRFIAASNRNLFSLVKQGKFREDLFYRINVVPLTVPPLRERADDIPALLARFLEFHCKAHGVEKRISPQAIDFLLTYDWPGNVRELQNLVEQMTITSVGPIIRPCDLPQAMKGVGDTNADAGAELISTVNNERKVFSLNTLDEIEKVLVLRALKKGRSTRKAAELLGVSQSTVVRKMRKYDISTVS